jgi:YspA, cpYpsA-related SLOG family
MRVIVKGGRHWAALDLAEDILKRLLTKYGPNLVIIDGGACGVDKAFAIAFRKLGVLAEPHLADWKGLGNVAGPARNRAMVASGADMCIAVHARSRPARERRIVSGRRSRLGFPRICWILATEFPGD